MKSLNILAEEDPFMGQSSETTKEKKSPVFGSCCLLRKHSPLEVLRVALAPLGDFRDI